MRLGPIEWGSTVHILFRVYNFFHEDQSSERPQECIPHLYGDNASNSLKSLYAYFFALLYF